MVNTFVIDADPSVTAKALDDRRLGKQRVEAMQIIDALLDSESKSKGWVNHPATRSWTGYIDALKDYCNVMIKEWIKRGNNNNMALYDIDSKEVKYPAWFSNKKVHYSHMARLLHKDPSYYKFDVPKEYLSYGYIWPYKWSIAQLTTLDVSKLAEPFKAVLLCVSNTKAGTRCRNQVKYGDKCGVHKEANYAVKICNAKLANGKPCKFKAKDGDKCGVHNKSNK